MGTVVALTSFVGVLETDVLGESRIEHHSEYPNQPSVFPGGKGFGAGSLERKIVKAGKSIQIARGQKFEDNHPAVKKWPELFGGVQLHPEVEAATAAPGEKRGK